MTSGRAARVPQWLERRRYRYLREHDLGFDDVREHLKTGDIILFHKSGRSGLLDALEMDLVSPLFYRETEFRHCGLIVRDGGKLAVLECADRFHSGHEIASYPWGGTGIREVPLEPLLEKYACDNGESHFGVRFIPEPIPTDVVLKAVEEIGPVGYLKAWRTISLYLSSLVLPRGVVRRIADRHAGEMMCSEFVHAVLSRCGALRDYTSKIFTPYIIENGEHFSRHDAAGYSDIVRFAFR
jgi:hypothetical protein